MQRNVCIRTLFSPITEKGGRNNRGVFRVKDVRKKELFHMLHTFSERNISLYSTLERLQGEFSEMKELKEVQRKITDGLSIAEAFRRSGLVDEFVYTTLKTGEESGQTGRAFETVYRYYCDRIKIVEELRRISLYPILVLINMGILILFSTELIFPQLIAMYESSQTDLPGILYCFKCWLMLREKHTSLLLGTVSIALFLIIGYVDRPEVRAYLNWKKYEVPLIGKVNRSIFLKNFTWRISVLLGADMKLRETLEIIKEAEQSPYLKEVYEDILMKITEGAAFYDAVASHGHLFSKMEVSYLRQGEESGAFLENIVALSLIHERNVERLSKKLSSYGQPLIVVALGLIVAAIVFTIMPLLNVSELYL